MVFALMLLLKIGINQMIISYHAALIFLLYVCSRLNMLYHMFWLYVALKMYFAR